MSKNHSRTFGGNRKGPGYRTASSFRGQVALKRVKALPRGFNRKPSP